MSFFRRKEQSMAEARPVPFPNEFKMLSPICQEILSGIRFSKEELNRAFAEARKEASI